MKFFQSLKASDILAEPLRLRSAKVTYCAAELSRSSENQIRDFYAALAGKAGSLVRRNEDHRNGDVVGQNDEWIDIVFMEDKKRESYRFSDIYQPLHTDGAYVDHQLDLSFLCCVQQAEVGGETIFLDAIYLHQIMDKYESDLLSRLCSMEVLFDKGEQQSKSSTIIRLIDSKVLLNWNFYRVSRHNPEEIVNLCESFHLFLENKIVRAGLCTPVKINRGDAVFFFDQMVLHGRNSFFGHRKLIKGGLSIT
jgi:alpha-ketoglutarate-dependent taurine dioxygenase